MNPKMYAVIAIVTGFIVNLICNLLWDHFQKKNMKNGGYLYIDDKGKKIICRLFLTIPLTDLKDKEKIVLTIDKSKRLTSLEKVAVTGRMRVKKESLNNPVP